MKKYIQKSLMLSAIICIIVTLVSFLCFEYREEMKLNFLIEWYMYGKRNIGRCVAAHCGTPKYMI